jgi:hypothetical protein
MVCAGAYAPAHTIFALPFYEGLSRYKYVLTVCRGSPIIGLFAS